MENLLNFKILLTNLNLKSNLTKEKFQLFKLEPIKLDNTSSKWKVSLKKLIDST